MSEKKKSCRKSRLITHFWLTFSLICLFISIVGMVSTVIVCDISSKKLVTFEQVVGKPKDSRCHIEMTIPYRSEGVPNAWESLDDHGWGAQYDIYVVNDSSVPFKNWNMKMKTPFAHRIDSSWNGVFTDAGDEILIQPVNEALNVMVEAHTKAKVGFVLYTPELLNDADFYLEGYFHSDPRKNINFILSLYLCVISCVFACVFHIFDIVLRRQKEAADKKITALTRLCARFIDTRDSYTRQHSTHVAEYSRLIAIEMGMDEDEVQNVYFNGLMHDIGKVLISRDILCKTSGLDDEEWSEMKKHTIYGANILEDFKEIPNVKETALYHHERYDGKGYMQGLKGEEIPLIARIVCVADSFDAMATSRAYRHYLPKAKILEELKNNAGTQFDPKIAAIMVYLIETDTIHVDD